MIKRETFPVGIIGTNCSLLFFEENGLLAVIDPGGDAPQILDAARRYPFRRAVALLTHAHIDHISALGELARELPLEAVRLDPDDLPLYRNPANQIPGYLPAAQDLPETVAGVDCPGMQILSLPGHTPGGSGYYFPAEKWLFSGDTIFERSVGRTDLPGGDWNTLQRSIRDVIYQLPEDTLIISGHGGSTTVGAEKRNNPYVR